MMRPLIYITFCLALLSSCSESPVNIRIDNPGKKGINIKMAHDQEFPFFIPKYGKRATKFIPGTYPIYLEEDSIGSVTLEPDKSYVINPTFANYYIEENVYAADNQGYISLPTYSIPLNFVTLDSMVYTGYFDIKSDLLIERNWDLDFKELPKKYIKTKGSGQISKKKIYRENSFIRFVVKPFHKKLQKEKAKEKG